MARSRKKTAAQHVMGVASMAMPAPLRDIVTTRWGARLSLVVVAAMVSSGVLSVDWTDGKPHVQVNKERAREVENNLEQRLAGRVDQFDDKHSQFGDKVNQFGNQVNQFGNQVNQLGNQVNQFTDKVNQFGNQQNSGGQPSTFGGGQNFGGQSSTFGNPPTQPISGQTAKERLTERWNKFKQQQQQ